MSKKPKLIYVKWRDSCGVSPTWEYLKDVKFENDIVTAESVGWLVSESKTSITLVSNMTNREDGEDVEIVGTMAIPKGCIIKRKFLKI